MSLVDMPTKKKKFQEQSNKVCATNVLFAIKRNAQDNDGKDRQLEDD